MIIYGHNDYRDYLAHHGILGQEWGKRNGPPYPLGYGDHSASEKKAGWKKSLNNSGEKKRKRYKLNYKTYTKNDGSPVVVSTQRMSVSNGLPLKSSSKWTKKQDMAAVNPDFFTSDDDGVLHNCMKCAVAYDLRRRGYDVQAGLASKSGIKPSKILEWYPNAEHKVMFDASRLSYQDYKKYTEKIYNSPYGNDELARKTIESLKKQGDGARGSLMMQFDWHGGHAVSYEVSKGKVVVRDCQANEKFNEDAIAGILRICVGAEYIRLDNADFDPDKIKQAVR